jgi:N-acetylglucosamine-6-phosphate deacetylase
VAGIHVEGPFLSPAPGYVGAHPPDAVRPADLSTALRLVDAGQGLVRMFTLAPEQDAGFAVTRRLARMGVCVAAGHADPDLDTLRAAVDAGLSAFTHLGNGCPDMLPRHDNVIVRALALAGPLRIGFIADGVHLPLYALNVYLAAAGIENAFVVSDVMAAGGMGPGEATIGRRRVRVGQDRAVRMSGSPYLAGSAMSLRDAAANLARVGRTPADIRRLLVEAPGALLA